MVRKRRQTFSSSEHAYMSVPTRSHIPESPGTSEGSPTLHDHRFRPTTFVDRWLSRSNGRQGTSFDEEDNLGGHDMPPIESVETHSLKSAPSRRASFDSTIDDVCMPHSPDEQRERRADWPDLGFLSDFAIKEMKDDLPSASDRLVNEAEEGGPLRPPRYVPWSKRNKGLLPYGQRSATDLRFTYFRDDLPATIHSPTIAGLLQPGQDFDDLFGTDNLAPSNPPPSNSAYTGSGVNNVSGTSTSGAGVSASSLANDTPPPPAPLTQINESPPLPAVAAAQLSTSHRGSPSPGLIPPVIESSSHISTERGPWWLDVLNPSEEEMRVLAKTFAVHPLTTEDIILRETREKVELFHHYYFICFASFDIKGALSARRRRDSGAASNASKSSHARHQHKERLKPLPVYTIVFKTGVLTIHYSPTPHTINVRRRIRLLRDYLNLTSDWISYALVDDITDGFAPMILAIEEDVQAIDEAILRMHGGSSDEEDSDDESLSGSSSTAYRQWRQQGDMLRWIGETRKRVMSVLGLLGNKADVIKGFTKRVTEQWSGASRGEIAMYLSDIQDHLVTMVQSLNHYEKLLARSHSNYLAQINIDMTKTNNDMNDVLGKLSVLGTIVLPMNIVTGLWGMNVVVPGQFDESGTTWFYSIIFFMAVFGIGAYFVLKRYV